MKPDILVNLARLQYFGKFDAETLQHFENGFAVYLLAPVALSKAVLLAKRARDLLLKAEKIGPAALDAGAPTSPGEFYYRVPGFPVGFGSTATAAKYLKEALELAPDGMDANYFAGDFLMEQGQYKMAQTLLQHALTLPARPDRPDWDYHRRAVIRELLAKIAKNLG